MSIPMKHQIVISGVGGQGVLFVTRLLAETAIALGYPVLSSETHGMAQRGGTVISHLKVGDFDSPLIRPRAADMLLSLHADAFGGHQAFLKPRGLAVVNATERPEAAGDIQLRYLDAEAVAISLGQPRSVNLVMLGCCLSRGTGDSRDGHRLFFSLDDIRKTLHLRLAEKPQQFEAAMAAIMAGMSAGPESGSAS